MRKESSNPEILQIHDGGGLWSVLAALVVCFGFVLTVTGLRPDEVTGGMKAASVVLALCVVLLFSGSSTTFDRAHGTVVKRWHLLPRWRRTRSLRGVTTVVIAKVDGESHRRFDVALRFHGGSSVFLWRLIDYSEARRRATTLADYLHLALEDGATDPPFVRRAGAIDRPFKVHASFAGLADPAAIRPPTSRIDVIRHPHDVAIRIARHPLGSEAIAGMAFLILLCALSAWTWSAVPAFLRQPRMSDPLEWVFPGLLVIVVGIWFPVTLVRRFIRAHRVSTHVLVSGRGIEVHERGLWRSRRVATVNADSVLDVGCDVTDAAKQDETSRGLIIRTPRGVTSFAADLDDQDLRYLCALVRRALAGEFRRGFGARIPGA